MSRHRLLEPAQRGIGNPFAASAAERAELRLRVERATAADLARECDEGRGADLLLARAHLAALDAEDPERIGDDPLWTAAIARRVGLSRATALPVVHASARCVRALAGFRGVSKAADRVRREVWSACFGRSLRHALALGRVIRDHDVLITGETGTGKEILAHAIAAGTPTPSGARKPPFAEVNVAALPETLLESELFGHVKGAFTGAVGDRKGRVRQADGGCLFLDEVGDLPMATQVKLLRVIENDEVTPLGSDAVHLLDVRYLAATHKDLEALGGKGEFREDLRQRLTGVRIHVAPLRERKEDIVVIGEAFVAEALAAAPVAIDMPAITRWLASPAARGRSFSGNVRELENILRSLLLGLPVDGGPELASPSSSSGTTDGLPPRIRDGQASLREVEDWYIGRALERLDGNHAAAARLLGLDRATVRRRATKLAVLTGS